MEISIVITLISGFLGSNVVVAWITLLFSRKKSQAETTEITVKTALELERRAHDRYRDTSVALEEAERILQTVKEQLQEQEKYITYLREILVGASIEHHAQDEWRVLYGCS